MIVPPPTIAWKERCTGTGLGHSSRGKAESPCTRASGSWYASRLKPLGTSIAYRVVRAATSGIPPIRSGAPRSVSNCPSSAASFTGW